MNKLLRSIWLATCFSIVAIVGTITSAPKAFAVPTPVIKLDESSQELGASFLLYEDKEGSLTVNEVLQMPDQFRQATLDDLNGEYSRANYWLRLSLSNQRTNDIWHVSAIYPLVKFEMYKLLEGGKRFELQENLDLRIPASRIIIPAGQVQEVLIRVSSWHVNNLQFTAVDHGALYDRDRLEGMFFALMCGCFLSMIIYNFFLYLTLRDVNYLYYLLFAITNSHMNLFAIKFPKDIFTLGGIDWGYFGNSYRIMAPLTAYLFVRSFLKSSSNYPKLDKVFLAYMCGLIALGLALLIVPTPELKSFTDLYFLIGLIILIVASVISLRDGFTPSRYYLAGLAAYFTGILIYLLRCEGLIPANIFTLNFHIVGQAAEMLLMSLALGGKIKMLEQENIRTKLMAQAKGRLLRVLFHDIANPLSVIKGTGYMMKSKEAESPSMKMIMRAVGMIEDIMQFVMRSESLESGKSIALTKVSVPELFESLAFLFNDKASQKGVNLKFVQAEANLMVRAESTSLRSEVMSNFISNAIKFSFPGSEVIVKAAAEGENTVVISVEDKGTGMSAETLAKIFDPLENMSQPGTSGERGTGYGMPLAKAYIDSYKAKIKVESTSIDLSPYCCGTTIRAQFVREY